MAKTANPEAHAVSVLLVDPHPISLLGLEQLLTHAKPFVLCASTISYKKALVLAKQLKPDLIVIDPLLDQADNLQLITQLQNQCQGKILILTSSSNAYILDQAVLLGARGILSKTEPTEAFLKAINCVQQGELWLNRNTTTRILNQVTAQNPEKEQSPEELLIQRLTKQEDRICRTIQRHAVKTLKEIASDLNISEHTLRNHLAAIYNKLGVRNRMELYVFCNKYQKTKDAHLHPKRRASDIELP